MGAEQLTKSLCFGFAELGISISNVSHRTVMLTQLRSRLGLRCCCGVALHGEPLGQHGQAHPRIVGRGDGSDVPLHERLGTQASKIPHTVGTKVSVEVVQRR